MAYDEESLWNTPSEFDPFGDDCDDADDPLYQTPPKAPVQSRGGLGGTKVTTVTAPDIGHGATKLGGSDTVTSALPRWHVDSTPGVPRHAATGAAGIYSAASVTCQPRQPSANAVNMPPRPQGVSQAEWERYISVISKGQKRNWGGVKAKGVNPQHAGPDPTERSRSQQGGVSKTVTSAKPVGTSDAEWSHYLAAVAEAKRQSRLAPTHQTHITVSTTVVAETQPQNAAKSVATKALSLGATPMAAVKEYQARERGKLSAGGKSSPASSPKLGPKNDLNVVPSVASSDVCDAPNQSLQQKPKVKSKHSRRKGSPKVARKVPLQNAEGHDDDWIFGDGLRQDHKVRPKAAESSVFRSVAPPPPPPQKVEAPAPPTEDPNWQARLEEIARRNRGELRRAADDSDDDDLFGGAAGIF
eukprot:m.276883 g.276883  ORF g.276883 m.276883 type:complete len:414 (-) comp26928_c1_seq1:1511-2752(-)